MQAPIGVAATPELVAAVSNAGGLGTLGASWTPLRELRRQLREIKRLTDRPFAVNLVLAFPQEERLELALAEGVQVIGFAWGSDEALVSRASSAGALVLVQIGSVGEAEAALRAGAGMLIAQGCEAGGHVQGTEPLLSLLEALVPLRAPLIAAGAIADAVSARAAVDAGAVAVASGTAFLAAVEADVHPVYRARLLDAGAGDTVLTTLFDVGWPNAPHRVLGNPTIAAWEEAGRPPPGCRPGEGETIATRAGREIVRYSDAMPTTATEGAVGELALYAGTGVGSVAAAEPAARIVERLGKTLSRG